MINTAETTVMLGLSRVENTNKPIAPTINPPISIGSFLIKKLNMFIQKPLNSKPLNLNQIDQLSKLLQDFHDAIELLL